MTFSSSAGAVDRRASRISAVFDAVAPVVKEHEQL